MRADRLTLVAIIGVVSIPLPAVAQDALLVRGASTLSQGKTLLWESLVFAEFTNRYDFERGRFTALDGDNRGFTSLTIVGYGVSERLELLVHLPFHYRVATAQGSTTSAGGLGDISFQSRMSLVRGGRPWPAVTLNGLVRVPSGDDRSRPALGDGTTDYGLALIVTETFDRLVWHFKLGYYFNGPTPKGADLGDQLLYMIKVDFIVARSGRLMLRELALMLGICGRLDYADEDPFGQRLAQTREYRPLSFVPMVRWTPVEGLFVRPRVVIPVRPLAEGGKIGAVQFALDMKYSF